MVTGTGTRSSGESESLVQLSYSRDSTIVLALPPQGIPSKNGYDSILVSRVVLLANCNTCSPISNSEGFAGRT